MKHMSLDVVFRQLEALHAAGGMPFGNTHLVASERDREHIMRDVARHLDIPEDHVTVDNLEEQLDKLGLTVEFTPDHWSSDDA